MRALLYVCTVYFGIFCMYCVLLYLFRCMNCCICIAYILLVLLYLWRCVCMEGMWSRAQVEGRRLMAKVEHVFSLQASDPNLDLLSIVCFPLK